jgi:hypothetical protein
MFYFFRDLPFNHTDAMRLQAENLEQAAHSRVTSRVTSRIGSVAPSLIASAIQSRRASRSVSAMGSTTASRYLICCTIYTYKFFSLILNIACVRRLFGRSLKLLIHYTFLKTKLFFYTFFILLPGACLSDNKTAAPSC